MNDLCQRVDEAMAELLEGTAPEELHDHVEACDRCRDARHDAERARELAADSGADYVPPPDMEARLERALDQAAPITERMSGPSTDRMMEPREVVMTPAAVVPVSGERRIVHERPAASKRVAVAQKWLRRPRNTLIAGLVGAAAVAATVALAVRPESAGEYADQKSWTGKVVKVSRAAGGEGGLEVCDHEGGGCAAATPGSLVTTGAVLKTDDRTRVYLEMSDGSRMALDRGTELALEPEGRRGKLARGAMVAEIATQKERPVRIALPRGHIEVLGTKFALRIMGDAASVDVSRGAVLLVDEGERSVKVQAGEEGRSYPGVPPYATAAPQLGEALSWSESNEDETIAVRGLGELKAKRPGGEEKRDAVRLTSHKVKVRIVDGFARTEIDEVFTNTTSEVLEGIYRFPLPPDAQIENLSLEVDGKLEPGAFVERSRAAAIWQGAIVNAGGRREPRQEIIWVPGPWRDPALLEWQRGGRFELRIFPIPKQGSRRVVLTYTQVVKPVAGVRRYVYPLAHDPSGALKVDRFDVDVQLRGHEKDFGVQSVGYNMTSGASGDATTLRFDSSSFVPSGDMVIEYATADRKSEVSAWAYEVPAGAVATAQVNQEANAK
ncbi:MAG TPA: VIT domain-containing protein, partial [Polyangiaceae bacterium]|nr:VIT domain-containing protein [Polyangiaceae bacterium]